MEVFSGFMLCFGSREQSEEAININSNFILSTMGVVRNFENSDKIIEQF